MLNEPVTEPLAPGADGGGQAGGQMPGMGGMQMPDDASYIHVTQEEKQAIDRVSASLLTTRFQILTGSIVSGLHELHGVFVYRTHLSRLLLFKIQVSILDKSMQCVVFTSTITMTND